MLNSFKIRLDEGCDIEVTIDGSIYSPVLLWEAQEKWLAQLDKNLEEWEKMSEDQQEGFVYVLKQGLQRLHDDVEEWLPQAFDVSTGNVLDITFKIMLTDVDLIIQKYTQMTEMKVSQAENSALELYNRLKED